MRLDDMFRDRISGATRLKLIAYLAIVPCRKLAVRLKDKIRRQTDVSARRRELLTVNRFWIFGLAILD
jgi:hypothetical protein